VFIINVNCRLTVGRWGSALTHTVHAIQPYMELLNLVFTAAVEGSKVPQKTTIVL